MMELQNQHNADNTEQGRCIKYIEHYFTIM